MRFSSAFNDVEALSERLLSLDKLKNEFLANTSHELRTPLNGMIGIAESLRDGTAGDLPANAKQNLSVIVSCGRRLSNLINDILDFSKLRNHDIELSLRTVDPFQTAALTLELTKSLLSEKKLELKNEIAPETHNVCADENRLQQILLNLLGNAVKFTPAGSITISAVNIGELVEICVSDTGLGIPENRREAIFQSFEQVDASTEREYGGTGLGLSITRQLVELHHGT